MQARICTFLVLAGCFFEQDPGAGVCGDGELGIDEQCDDGNTMDGDSCSSICRKTEGQCGNGRRDVGEECDWGSESNVCAHDCTFFDTPRIQVDWFFLYLGKPEHRCPMDVPTAINIHVQPYAAGQPVGAETIQTTECTRGSELVELPAFGIYHVWVDATMASESYVARPVTVDVTSRIFTRALVPVYLNAGYPRVAWSITDMQDAPIDCAQAGASLVEFFIEGAADPLIAHQTTACTLGWRDLGTFPVGTYQVSANLLSPTSVVVATLAAFSVGVSAPNALDITNVTFKVTP